ncbi:hypothetical protein ACFVYF_37800, partial [Streptomyces sp. NPDC058274]
VLLVDVYDGAQQQFLEAYDEMCNQVASVPGHARAAAVLRGDYRHHQASRAQAARRHNAATASDLVEVEQRQLDSYDRMFTLIEGGGQADDPEVS